MNPDTLADIRDALNKGDIEQAMNRLLMLAVEGLEHSPPDQFTIKDITGLADALTKVRKESRLAEMQRVQLEDREAEKQKESIDNLETGDWMRRLNELQATAKSL